jgi:hypothetical protein
VWTKLAPIVLCVSPLIQAGCDPVRSTRQAITIKVSDSANGAPLGGVTIRMKNDFDTSVAMSPTASKWSKELRDSARKQWELNPWATATTSMDGKAVLIFECTALDRSRGPEPPAVRDSLTGQPYLMQIVCSGCESMNVTLVLQQNNEFTQGQYSVQIVGITSPEYIYEK